MSRLERTTVYLTVSQYDKLKLLSKKTRVPMAVYIRDAVDKVIKVED